MPDFLDWLMAQAAAAGNAPPVPADTYDYGMPLSQLRQEMAASARAAAQQAELDAFNAAANTSGGNPTVVTPPSGGNTFLEGASDAAAAFMIGRFVNSIVDATPQTLSPIHSTPTYNGQYIDPNRDTYGTAAGGEYELPSDSSSGGDFYAAGGDWGPSPFSSGPGSYYSDSYSGSSAGGDF